MVAGLLITTGCGLLPGTSAPGADTTPGGPASVPAGSTTTPVASPTPVTDAQLADALSADGITTHLAAWQRIAEANDGHRGAGSPGYRASVDYARGVLSEAGYRVSEQTFTFTDTTVRSQRAERLDGAALELPITAMQGTPSTPAGGVEATAGVPTEALGCRAEDYRELRGAIAVVQRGTCPFAQKSELAAAAGAVAVLVVDSEGGDRGLVGTLGTGEAERAPTAGISQEAGARLRAAMTQGPVRLRVAIEVEVAQREGINLIADGPAAPDGRVIMSGAHLDSVDEGPGINDNASGSALVLETAVQLARLGQHTGTRFAFWDAEELGLIGSRHYVDTLDDPGRDAITAYLNFDMVASPNGVPQSYGDDGIRRRFERVFTENGRTLGAARIGGASDHAPFEQAGIAIGGLFTGAGERPSSEQAREWDVDADLAMDPCYHQACDALSEVESEAVTARLELIADATIVTIVDLVRTGR